MDQLQSYKFTESDCEQLFVDDEWKKYICGKCWTLLRKAVQTCCGHWLCESCADDLFHIEFIEKITARCPTKDCGKVLKGSDGREYFADRWVRLTISKMVVRCQVPTCQWTGQYQAYTDHTKFQHRDYTIKPERRSEANMALVDINEFEATVSSHHSLEKLSKELGEMLVETSVKLNMVIEKEKQWEHCQKQVSKSMEKQNDSLDPVRVTVSERVESPAQSTASLGPAGRETPHEKLSTSSLNANGSDEMVHFEVKPVSQYPPPIPQTSTTTTKTAIVTGADSVSTGAHSAGAHSSSPVKEEVVLRKREKSPTTLPQSDPTQSPPSSSPPKQSPLSLPPIPCTTTTSKELLPSPPPRPLRSPTEDSTGVPPLPLRPTSHTGTPLAGKTSLPPRPAAHTADGTSSAGKSSPPPRRSTRPSTATARRPSVRGHRRGLSLPEVCSPPPKEESVKPQRVPSANPQRRLPLVPISNNTGENPRRVSVPTTCKKCQRSQSFCIELLETISVLKKSCTRGGQCADCLIKLQQFVESHGNGKES